MAEPLLIRKDQRPQTAPASHDPEEDFLAEKLLFTDFAALLEAGLEPERPTVCQAYEGLSLLYRGRINEIHGEPGIGKTNILLRKAIAVMEAGGLVLYLDPEDNPAGIGSRLLQLGCPRQSLLELFKYVHNPEPGDYERLHAWAREHGPVLVILDGLAEALTAENLNEDVPSDVLDFFRRQMRPFAEAEAAVLVADHVAKNKDTRGRYARGSSAKLGRYDGVSYEVRLVKAYSRETEGSVRLVVAKDRCGGIGPQGTAVCDLVFTTDEDGKPDIYFAEPQEKPAKPFKPTALMEKISRHLENAKVPLKKTELRGLGSHDWAEKAITQLVDLGHITLHRQGQALMHTLAKPYRENGVGGSAR
jgi:hypothetical protein